MRQSAKLQSHQPPISFTMMSEVDWKEEKYSVSSVRQQELTAGAAEPAAAIDPKICWVDTDNFATLKQSLQGSVTTVEALLLHLEMLRGSESDMDSVHNISYNINYNIS